MVVFHDPHGGLFLCFGLIPYAMKKIYSRWIPHNLRNTRKKHRDRIFPTFLYTNRHDAFFECFSNCAESNENKSFSSPGVHAILNVCWWKKCPRMPLSHDMSHGDLALSIHARHQCFLTVFGRPLRTSSFNDRRPQLNSLNQFFTVLLDGDLSPNKDFSSSMRSCCDYTRRNLYKMIERKCSRVNSILFDKLIFLNHCKQQK